MKPRSLRDVSRVPSEAASRLPEGIALRRAEDDDQLFKIYAEVFGPEDAAASRRRWRWQYIENPTNGAQGPEIWVVRHDGQLMGQYASMAVRLWWGDREVHASWGMDVFVKEEARRLGLGERLFRAWSDNVDVALGLGLTSSSYGLFRKLGFRDLGLVPFFQRVLDPRAVAVRRLGSVLGAAAAPALGVALRALYPERPLESFLPERPFERRVAVEIRKVTGFGAEYDRLWDALRRFYVMCVRRDAAYLNWKYVQCPRRYDIREARRKGDLVGFVVTRHEDYRGLRLGWIVDVFADPSDHEAKDALLEAALEDFRQARVARAQAFSLNAALAWDLKRRGFMPGRSTMQFCVHSRTDPRGALDSVVKWHVVFGDSDMDR